MGPQGLVTHSKGSGQLGRLSFSRKRSGMESAGPHRRPGLGIWGVDGTTLVWCGVESGDGEQWGLMDEDCGGDSRRVENNQKNWKSERSASKCCAEFLKYLALITSQLLLAVIDAVVLGHRSRLSCSQGLFLMPALTLPN